MKSLVHIVVLYFCSVTLVAEEPIKAQKVSLQDAIRSALQSNPKILKMDKEVSIYKNRVSGARSAYLPKLALEVTGGTARDKDLYTDEIERPKTNRDHNFYNSNVVASYNLFRGMSDRNTETQYVETLASTEALKNQTHSEVTRDVILSYFKVQLIQRKITAEKEAKILRGKQLTEVKNRNRAGSATRLEVLQAEYALKNTEPEIRKLENELQLATLELQQLMSGGFTQTLVLENGLETAFISSKAVKTPPLSQLYEKALKSNQALQVLHHENKRVQAELKSVQGSFWPSVDLRFVASSRAFVKDEIFDEDVRTYSGELALTIPLFDGLKSFADRAAIHDKLASQAFEEKIERDNLLQDITRYHQKRELAYGELTSEESNLELAEESIKQSRNLYEAGSAKLTDVLDAYTQKFAAVKNLGQAMYNHIEATAWLQYYTDSLDVETMVPKDKK